MDKLTEALKNLIPADQLAEVSKAVEEMIAEATDKLEQEYNEKLKEAFAEFEADKKEIVETRETGYQQAYAIIDDLQKRLETQRDEYETHMEEQFGEAWKMIEAEKANKENIEVELYKEFDDKLKEMKNFMVDKVDQFLQLQNAEIYEHAKKDVLNDPRTLEHKVAFDKITNIVADRLSDEDYSHVTSSKLEEAQKQVEDLRANLRILESKNTKLNMQNTRLTEQVKQQNNLITESVKTEKKERTESAKNVSGRGHRVAGETVIPEFNNPAAAKNEGQEEVLSEVTSEMQNLLKLAGINPSK